MSLYVWLCSGDAHHELAYENHELLFTFLGCLGFAAGGRSIWTGLYSEGHGEPTGREELGGEKGWESGDGKGDGGWWGGGW